MATSGKIERMERDELLEATASELEVLDELAEYMEPGDDDSGKLVVVNFRS